MVQHQQSTPTSPPSSSDTAQAIMRHQAAATLILADLLAMQLRSQHPLSPTKSGPKTPWFSIAASVKAVIDYISAAHKFVLLWRAISFGYIGRELLRWFGWL